MRILGGLIAIALAVWFYRTAAAKGQDPFPWAIAGVIFYYLPMGLWTWLVNPKIRVPHPTSDGPSVWVMLAPTLVGIGVSLALRQFVLLKTKPQ